MATLFGQSCFNGFNDFGRIGLGAGCKSRGDFTIAANEEFLEIPGDLPLLGRLRIERRQVLVKVTGIVTVDFDLFKQRKINAILGAAERLDFRRLARLLATELIARESQHHQSLIMVLLVQFLQLLVLRVSPHLLATFTISTTFPW